MGWFILYVKICEPKWMVVQHEKDLNAPIFYAWRNGHDWTLNQTWFSLDTKIVATDINMFCYGPRFSEVISMTMHMTFNA